MKSRTTTPHHDPPIARASSRVAEFVAFCKGAAEEAAAAVAEAKPGATWTEMLPAAHDAFLNALPVPSTPEMTQIFIACIVQGVASGFLQPGESGTLLNISVEARQVQRTMLWAQQLGASSKTPLFSKKTRAVANRDAAQRKKKIGSKNVPESRANSGAAEGVE